MILIPQEMKWERKLFADICVQVMLYPIEGCHEAEFCVIRPACLGEDGCLKSCEPAVSPSLLVLFGSQAKKKKKACLLRLWGLQPVLLPVPEMQFGFCIGNSYRCVTVGKELCFQDCFCWKSGTVSDR